MYLSNKCGNSSNDMTIKFFFPKYLETWFFFIICNLLLMEAYVIESLKNVADKLFNETVFI